MAEVAPVVPVAPVVAPRPAAPVVAPEAADFLELVVDGQPKRLSKAEAIIRLQKEEAADKRFMAASEKAKRTDAMLEALANDPEAVLEKLGIDVDAISQKRLAKLAADKLLTDEQRKQRDLEAKVAKFEAAEKARKDEETNKAQQAMDEKTATTIEAELVKAAETHGLDQNPATLELMIDIALEAIELGYPLTADQVALETIKKQEEHIKQRDGKLLKLLKGEKLLKYLGDDVLKSVQDATLERMKLAPAPAKPEPAESKPAPGPKHYRSERDVDAKLAKLIGK